MIEGNTFMEMFGLRSRK